MMNKYLLGSILVLLGWSSLAQAQGTLGAPVPPENQPEAPRMTTPAVYSPGYQSDGQTQPNHPFLGRIARIVTMPIRAATRHFMPAPAETPTPTKDEVNRMVADGGYSPAEIAAAKIKIDEAAAMARRTAVRYLASVDCHYYPEVEDGLIAALRADRAETVRYEAAVALGYCKGLTPRMLEAMNMTALGVELDGNPAETSERVRAAARTSLHQCMIRGLCLPPAGEQPTASWSPPPFVNTIQPAAYYLPTSAPISPAILQQERERAETVSLKPNSPAPAASTRSFFDFMRNFTLRRESTDDGQRNIDPRLRGLTPLGSEGSLAMPANRE